MNTRKEKAVFLAAVKNEITKRETLRMFLTSSFQDLLKKFDGKVYNKRFNNALRDALKAVSPEMWCECKFRGPEYFGREKELPNCPRVEIALHYYKQPGNYIDVVTLWTNIVLCYDSNYNARINAEYTGRDGLSASWLQCFDENTDGARAILKNYDAFMSVADELKTAICKYNDLPYQFRENIVKEYFIIH